MMANPIPPSHPRMFKALARVHSAHQAIRDGIATHAEKHESAIDARRRKLEEDARIANGIAAANAKVHGNTQAR